MAIPKTFQISQESDNEVKVTFGREKAESSASTYHEKTPGEPDNVALTQTGDLADENGDRSIVFSSQILTLSSEWFQELPSMTASPEQAVKTVTSLDLDAVDEEAMSIIRHILHRQSREVPEKISIDALSNIAKLSSKHFWNEALKPIITCWIRDYAADLGADATTDH